MYFLRQNWLFIQKIYQNSLRRNMSKEAKNVIPVEEAKRFMVDCFVAAGASSYNAEVIADNLIEADYRGHISHGMNRLENYVRDIQTKRCDPNATCSIEKETVATALVNGNNGFGAVVGKFSMDLAIKKAKNVGIGLVTAHCSNHYGVAVMYPLQALKEGMIGLSFSNTSPLMVPTRAKDRALGTNPITIGAPGCNGEQFLLDMATTAVAAGKLEIARRKGIPLKKGWALNEEGQVETNADVAYKLKKLMPLGGTEEDCGFKGYGLAMLVEIFCGMLSGSNYGPNIRTWGPDNVDIANLGQGFLAINPNMFADGFQNRLSDLTNFFRNMTPVDPKRPVSVHGDIECKHEKQIKEDGGFAYMPDQLKTCDKLAEELNVRRLGFSSTS